MSRFLTRSCNEASFFVLLVLSIAVATLITGQLIVHQAFAGDGKIVVIREVPYQSVGGLRFTGQAHKVDVAPDEQILSGTNGLANKNGNYITELTDGESSIIAGGVLNNTTTITSTQQAGSSYDGSAMGRVVNTLGDKLSPTGSLGAMTSSVGGGVGGGVSRATDTLSSALSGAMSHSASFR